MTADTHRTSKGIFCYVRCAIARLRLSIAAALVFACGGAAAQPAAAPFSVGKAVSLHVGTEAGGTNDQIMRIVARHLGKYLPGNPTVVPRNTPGAGGRRLAALLSNTAPRDGTELGVLQRGITTDGLLIDSPLPFKVPDLTWIGTPSGTTDLCVVWHGARVQNVADIQKTELVIAGTGNEATQVLILQRLTGGKVRTVIGYPGGAAINLALERGEADGRCSVSWEALRSNYPEWVAEKKVRPLVQFAFARHPELPDVPLIGDLAKTAIDREALGILLLPQAFGFPFAAPPGLLPEVTAMLRTAFAQTMRDPQLIEEAQRIKLELMPVHGEELQRRVRAAYAAPPGTIAHAKQLIAPN
jgi:tripartite-type tricarboxylate transporter receptor subunit TctC